jgi:hypothetical protein
VFVPESERLERSSALRAAGVAGVVTSWHELVDAIATRLQTA